MHIAKDKLKQKAKSAVFWVIAISATNRILSLVTSGILARLLAPEHFGLIASSIAVIAIVQSFTQTGLDSALVQSQSDISDKIDVAWTLDMLRAIIVFALIYVLAPLIGTWFDEEKFVEIVRCLSISVLINGFRNTGMILYVKNLQFRQQFVLETFPVLIYLAVAGFLAWCSPTVWALVWAFVAQSAASVAVTYILHPHRPRIKFDKAISSGLFGFGRWIMFGTVLATLWEHGLSIFLQKAFSTEALGHYNRSLGLSTQLTRNIVAAGWRIGFPMFSAIGGDGGVVKSTINSIYNLIILVGAPICFGIFAIAPDATILVLSDKFASAIPIVKLLVLLGFIEILLCPLTIAFQATGRPRHSTYTAAVSIAAAAIVIYPLSINWGIMGAVYALLAGQSCGFIYALYLGKKYFDLRLPAVIIRNIAPLIATGLMVGTVTLYLSKLDFDTLTRLVISIGCGATVFVLCLVIFERLGLYPAFQETINAIRTRQSRVNCAS